jgi:hypothetical protein
VERAIKRWNFTGTGDARKATPKKRETANFPFLIEEPIRMKGGTVPGLAIPEAPDGGDGETRAVNVPVP